MSRDVRALGAHLDGWARCQILRAWLPRVDCTKVPDVPPRLAQVAAHLRMLVPLEQIAELGHGRRRSVQRATRCLLAMSLEVRALVSEHPRSRRRVDRVCDELPVRTSGSGRTALSLPRACAHAVDEEGRIVGARLGDCLRTLGRAWLAEAGIGRALRRPNIVFVLADDQRWDTIDATHSPMPALGLPAMPATYSRLAAEGVTFTDAVVTTPICGPSRGSFLTGLHTYRHGMLQNDGEFGPARFADGDTIATRLDAAGYRTSYLGKYANGFTDLWDADTGTPIVPPGWDDFRIFDYPQSVKQLGPKMIENGVRVDYADAADPPYSTDLLARHALDFIDSSLADAPDEPFALFIGTTTPHYPFTPAPRHVGAFAGYELVTYPSTFEEDVSDKPDFIQRRDPLNPLHRFAQLFGNRTQLEMQLSTDELVAAVLDRLEEHGVGDDTIFVYTSDNGQAWGEHRWGTKGCPWDECLRVPMLVRYPRKVSGPREVAGLVANVDVLPTLLGLAGVEAPDDVDGIDLGGALRESAPLPERDVLIEAYGGVDLTYAGVRTDDWKYIRYATGDEALYDLRLDPFELDDWSDAPGNEGVLDELRARLDELWPGFDAVGE